jgi:DNA polymerase-3 subunit delta
VVFLFLATRADQRYNSGNSNFDISPFEFTPMLLFVYGDDGFRTQEKVSQLKSAFREKHDPSGLNTVVFPSADGKLVLGDVIQAVTTLPFLSKHRMVIIRDLIDSVKKEDLASWESGLSRTSDSSIVILWESKDVASIEKKPLFKTLNALAQVHAYPFPALAGSSLTTWIADRCKLKGSSIESGALRSLIERVGSDLWQMSHEIDKLIAFANGKTITETMVTQLVQANFEGKIFELVDALSKKDVRATVRMLEEERFAGSDDFYLMSMFSRQIRLLLGARSVLDQNPQADKNAIATELDVHPFVASKLVVQAKNFSLKQLLDAHTQLFEFDRAMKSGGISADLAVDLVATNLLKKE